jgi:oxalate decarboxylase/phosphoglucose isomerase-like protein (cupin superfamily)
MGNYLKRQKPFETVYHNIKAAHEIRPLYITVTLSHTTKTHDIIGLTMGDYVLWHTHWNVHNIQVMCGVSGLGLTTVGPNPIFLTATSNCDNHDKST